MEPNLQEVARVLVKAKSERLDISEVDTLRESIEAMQASVTEAWETALIAATLAKALAEYVCKKSKAK